VVKKFNERQYGQAPQRENYQNAREIKKSGGYENAGCIWQDSN